MPKLRSLCCLLFILLIAPAHAAEVITPEQAAEGWIALFDGQAPLEGQPLFGWQATSDANWRVEDGEIRVDAGKEGWLMTTSEFADYELHVEFKAPASTNSGIFLRTPLDPKDPTKDCYEVNIAPEDNPFPLGSIVGRMKWPEWTSYPKISGFETVQIPLKREDAEVGWISLDITTVGGKLAIRLLGGPGQKYTDPNPIPRGRIGLQFKEGAIAFRNIRLKPLGLKPLFNGKDLAGWNTDRANKSEFTVTPAGEIAVRNGPGQLETNDSFGDFVMQLDAKVNGDGLNSGVFFRCIPGDVLMGYESQIHNGMKDGDPTKPVDAGTGAIYRRTTARRIVAHDHEWFTKTIIATGAHIAVWVDGIQVTDWTDDRKPDENPRRGLRTAPGTIAIQGHDPTTDLLFRNLKIAELPK
jgi:hypothetical protein